MLTQKSYIRDDGQATIVCPSCGREKVADLSQHKDRITQAKVKCPCGSTFVVHFEKRKHYRKKVNLPGHYMKPGPPKEIGEILVEDISRFGIAFTTMSSNTIQIDDIIKVRFTLDDSNDSELFEKVIVKRVEERSIGAQFLNVETNKPLAFYMRP